MIRESESCEKCGTLLCMGDCKMNKLVMPNNLYDMMNLYAQTKSGHFFDESTMDFFKSKLTNYYWKLDDDTAVFITTEKKCFEDNRRVSSVRLAKINGGKINIETELHAVTTGKAKRHYDAMKNEVSK